MTLTTKIADPYASALLDLAVSTHTVDLVTADINELLEIFNTNEELVDYLTNPLYSISSKKAVLKKVIEPNFFNQNTTRFMMVLTERSRIGLFQAIAEKYLKLVYDLAEIKIAQVTSAFELTANQDPLTLIENAGSILFWVLCLLGRCNDNKYKILLVQHS